MPYKAAGDGRTSHRLLIGLLLVNEMFICVIYVYSDVLASRSMTFFVVDFEVIRN